MGFEKTIRLVCDYCLPPIASFATSVELDSYTGRIDLTSIRVPDGWTVKQHHSGEGPYRIACPTHAKKLK